VDELPFPVLGRTMPVAHQPQGVIQNACRRQCVLLLCSRKHNNRALGGDPSIRPGPPSGGRRPGLRLCRYPTICRMTLIILCFYAPVKMPKCYWYLLDISYQFFE
jgi:hypothetical protein